MSTHIYQPAPEKVGAPVDNSIQPKPLSAYTPPEYIGATDIKIAAMHPLTWDTGYGYSMSLGCCYYVDYKTKTGQSRRAEIYDLGTLDKPDIHGAIFLKPGGIRDLHEQTMRNFEPLSPMSLARELYFVRVGGVAGEVPENFRRAMWPKKILQETARATGMEVLVESSRPAFLKAAMDDVSIDAIAKSWRASLNRSTGQSFVSAIKPPKPTEKLQRT